MGIVGNHHALSGLDGIVLTAAGEGHYRTLCLMVDVGDAAGLPCVGGLLSSRAVEHHELVQILYLVRVVHNLEVGVLRVTSLTAGAEDFLEQEGRLVDEVQFYLHGGVLIEIHLSCSLHLGGHILGHGTFHRDVIAALRQVNCACHAVHDDVCRGGSLGGFHLKIRQRGYAFGEHKFHREVVRFHIVVIVASNENGAGQCYCEQSQTIV